ncbi:MAG: methyl-accepting chemotaxis protein [Planctomycetota bacterium]|nr:methyl-accepting chemotaxis protein [Planctomycetota bacterium]
MAFRMTIGVRLGMIGAVAVLAVASLSTLSVSMFREVTHGVSDLLIKQQALRNHQDADMMHDAVRGDILAARQATDAAGRAEALKDFEEHANRFAQCVKENRELELPADIRSTLDGVEGPLNEYVSVARRQLESEKITEEGFATFMTAFSTLETKMGDASDAIENATKAAADAEFTALRRGNTAIIAGSVVACVAVFGLVWFIARGILVPLRQCVAFLGRVADGDLSQRMNLARNDELGELAASADKLVLGLSGIVTNIGKAAESVGAAATEMAAASEEISRSATEQTNRVEQIAAAVEEMAASVSEVASKSSDAVANARESGNKAESGGQIVGNAVNEMHAIDTSVSQTAQLINELGERSQQIGQIIAVIDDIAAQTNLLALNAAIEAARAGEHGRGFAVVADEVRKLADRTTKATEEIAGSINAIREQTTRSVERMQQGSAQVRKGVEQATAAGNSLGEIVQKTAAVSQMVESIAAAAEQQRHAGEEVSKAIQEIAGSSRQSQNAVSQGAQTAQDLAERATELKGLISRFKLVG